jgi:hypothetical protein
VTDSPLQVPAEHVLIFQTDTFLLNDTLDAWTQWDYVGAPWGGPFSETPWMMRNLLHRVGNGGLSLRRKSAMLKCIDEVSPCWGLSFVCACMARAPDMLDRRHIPHLLTSDSSPCINQVPNHSPWENEDMFFAIKCGPKRLRLPTWQV